MEGKWIINHRRKTQQTSHLTKGNDEAAHSLLLAGEADVVGGDEHLAQDVSLVEGRPESAVRVSVQLLILRQAKQRTVALALGSGIQVPCGDTQAGVVIQWC